MVLAVPTQDTYTVGEILTAVLMNKNVRDGVNFVLNPPLLQATVAATQSLANTTFTDILWDTNLIDTYAGHSTVTNTARYTAQVAGVYHVAAKLGFAAGAVGIREIALAKNGTQITASIADCQAVTVALTSTTISTEYLVTLAVNDFVTVQGFQANGGALALSPTICKYEVQWVHS